MNIISSYQTVFLFEKIKEFQRDFGFTVSQDLKKDGNIQSIIKIRDPFVRHYFELYQSYPNKHGKIGDLGFYVVGDFPNDKFIIFDEDKEYNINFKSSEIINMREFLGNKIKEVQSGTLEKKDLTVHTDGSIEFFVDPKLPPEQYHEEMLKMMEKMEEIGLVNKE